MLLKRIGYGLATATATLALAAAPAAADPGPGVAADVPDSGIICEVLRQGARMGIIDPQADLRTALSDTGERLAGPCIDPTSGQLRP